MQCFSSLAAFCLAFCVSAYPAKATSFKRGIICYACAYSVSGIRLRITEYNLRDYYIRSQLITGFWITGSNGWPLDFVKQQTRSLYKKTSTKLWNCILRSSLPKFNAFKGGGGPPEAILESQGSCATRWCHITQPIKYSYTKSSMRALLPAFTLTAGEHSPNSVCFKHGQRKEVILTSIFSQVPWSDFCPLWTAWLNGVSAVSILNTADLTILP